MGRLSFAAWPQMCEPTGRFMELTTMTKLDQA